MPTSSMWPLPLLARTNHLIAGKTVTEHRYLFISEEIHAEENVWISAEDQAKLKDAKNATLLGNSDESLATIGSGETIIHTSDSFFIKFPWQLIDIAEDIISNITESDIKGEIHANAVIEGNLQLGAGSRILPGVFIEGNVVIGEDCKIGPNCYIRGNTSIGKKCHIGQLELKNSIVGNNSKVGHLSYVGDSLIGDNVNLGAGTIISNYRHDGSNHKSMIDDKLIDTGRRKFGSIVGDGVHTGINTSIYPGRKLQAHSSTLPCEVVHKDLAY